MIGFFSVVEINVNANKNSFHVLVKANITATAIPVLDTGKNILVITIKGLHPSILAASTTSLGTPSKVAFNIRTINARLKVVFISTRLNQLSINPSLFIMVYRGMMTMTGANIWLTRTR